MSVSVNISSLGCMCGIDAFGITDKEYAADLRAQAKTAAATSAAQGFYVSKKTTPAAAAAITPAAAATVTPAQAATLTPEAAAAIPPAAAAAMEPAAAAVVSQRAARKGTNYTTYLLIGGGALAAVAVAAIALGGKRKRAAAPARVPEGAAVEGLGYARRHRRGRRR